MAIRKRQGDDDAKGFLSRWSERKRAAEEGTLAEQPQGAERDPDASASARDTVAEGTAEQSDSGTLPDVASLDAGADFSAFMKQGVPRALQRRALRRLWQVDPAFHEICMLDDYNLDYTDAAMVVPNLKTVYQVGKGMVLDDEEEEQTAPEESSGESPGENTAAAPTPDDEESSAAAAPPELQDRGGEASEVPVPAASPGSKAKTRNPGDPVVSDTATRRRAVTRPPRRSALRRRWGDADG